MKIFRKHKKLIIVSFISVVLTITVGCFFLFRNGLEEVYIPEDANLSSTTLARPTSGLPSDYSAKDNLYIAQGVANTSSFSTITDGMTKAAIVNQAIYAERVVTPNSCYKKSISTSTFVKVGTECYVSGDTYLVRKAKDVDSISEYEFVNDDSYLTKLTEEEYYNFYGYKPSGLSGFIINDSTILSATFVGVTSDGLYEFEYTLDPTLSTIASRNEMRTMAGTEKHPTITAVTFKLWLHSNWDIAKTYTHSEYKVEMKGLGVISCEENRTEYFTFDNPKKIENESYFQSKLDSTDISTELVIEPSTTEILLDAFGDYLEGEDMLLDFTLAGETPISGQLKLNLDTKNLANTKASIKLDNSDIQINYEDNKVYLSTSGINGYIDIDDYSDIFEELLFEFGISLDAFDNFNTDELLNDLKLENSDTKLLLKLDTNLLGFDIDANLSIDKATKSITADITLNDEISIELKSAQENKIKDTSKFTYYSFAPLIETLLNQKIYLTSSISDDLSFKMLLDFSSLQILGNAQVLDKNIIFNITPSSFQAEIDGVLTQSTNLKQTLRLIIASFVPPEMFDDFDINVGEIFSSIRLEKDESDNINIIIPISGIEVKAQIQAEDDGYKLSNILIDTASSSTNIEIKDFIQLDKIDGSLEPISLDNFVKEITTGKFTYTTNLLGLNIDLSLDIFKKEIYASLNDYGIDAIIDTTGIFLQKGDLKGFVKFSDSEKLIALLTPLIPADKVTTLADMLESIDLNAIIESIALNRTSTSLSLTATINGKELSVTLPVTDGNLSISNISLTCDEFNLSLNASEVSHKVIDRNEYSDLTPLLSILDGGLITFETDLDGHSLKATIDILSGEVHAILDGSLKMLISGNMAYASYSNATFKLDPTTLLGIIPMLANLNIELPTMPSIDLNKITYALQNIETSTNGNITSIILSIDKIKIVINLVKENNAYSIYSANICIDDFALEIVHSNSDYNSNIDTNNTELISLDSLINEVTNGKFTYTTNLLGLNIDLSLDIFKKEIYASLNDYGIDAIVDTTGIFLQKGDLKGFVKFSDSEKLIALLTPLIPADKVAPLADMLESIDLNAIIESIALNRTSTSLSLTATINGKELSVTLPVADGNLSISNISLTCDEFNLSLNSSEVNHKVIDRNEYSDLTPLLSILDGGLITFETDLDGHSLKATIDILNGEVHAILDGCLKMLISGNMAYASYSNATFKLDPTTLLGIIPMLASLNIELPTMPSIDLNKITYALQNIETSTNGNITSIILSIDKIKIAINLVNENNAYSIYSANICIDDFALEIVHSNSDYNSNIDTNNAELISLDNLINEVTNGKFTYTTNLLGLNIDLSLDIFKKEIYASLNDYGIDALIDTTGIFLQKGDLKGFVKFSDSEKLIALLTPLIPADKVAPLADMLESIDLNAIIESIALNRTSTSLSLTATINGKELSVTLPVADGNLSISNISLNCDEFNLLLNASEVNHKVIDRNEYSDLTPLLSILDGGLITFETDLDGHSLKATIDILSGEVHAILDESLKMLISGNMAYASYNDLSFMFNLNALKDLLPKLSNDLGLDIPDLSSFASIKINELIQSLETSTNEDLTILSLSIGKINLVVNLNNKNNIYTFNSAVANIDDLSLTLTYSSDDFHSNIDTINGSFIDANDVINTYYDTLISIIKANYININGGGVIKTQEKNSKFSEILYTLDLSLPISSQNKYINVSLDLTINEYTSNEITKTSSFNVVLYYQNERIYFSFNGIKGTFHTNELEKSQKAIEKIFANIPQLAGLIDTLGEVTNINLDIASWDLYSIIKDINYNKSKDLSLILNLTTLSSVLPENLEIMISKIASDTLHIETLEDTSFEGINIGISANVRPLTKNEESEKFTIAEPDSYTVFDSINNLLETLANTVSLRHFHVKANVSLKLVVTIDLALDLKVDIDDNGVATIIAVIDNYSSSALGSSIAFKHDKFKTIIYTRTNSDIIYYSKYYEYSETTREQTGTGLFGIPKYEWITRKYTPTDYGTFTAKDFSAHAMDMLVYLLDLSDTIKDSITKNSGSDSSSEATVEEVFQGYHYTENENKYTVELNLSSLSSMLGDLNVDIIHTAPSANEEMKLSKLNASLKLMGFINVNLEATMQDYNNQDYGTSASMDDFIRSHTFTPMY